MILGIDISRVNQEQRTGVEWYVYYLLEQFATLMPPDVTVRLYTNGPLVADIKHIIPTEWEVKELGWPPKRLWTQIRLSWEMFWNPPDVLFIPAHVFPYIHPKKTVMTVHDVAARHFPDSYNWFERWYSLWSSKKAARHLWRVIVPSHFTKYDVLELAGLPKEDEHIYVVPHGYDKTFKLPHTQEECTRVLETYGVTKPYLFSIGRLEYKKNTVAIVRAFNKIKEKHDLQLVLVGKPGYGYQEVANAIAESPYSNDIIQPGWVEEKDVPIFYASARAFVFPSLFEGFGIPLLEAFACGAPVITSTSSSLPEVAGDAALYVSIESLEELVHAMDRLVTDSALRSELVKKGVDRVKAYSWEKAARETLQVLGVL